jgi:hypothetical protein
MTSRSGDITGDNESEAVLTTRHKRQRWPVPFRVMGLLALALLASCSSMPFGRDGTRSGLAILPDEERRAALASRELAGLEERDVHVRLANESLAKVMRAVLQEMAARDGSFSLRDIAVRFRHQVILLEARHDWETDSGMDAVLSLSGEISLSFSGNQLLWTPRFSDARAIIRDSTIPTVIEENTLEEAVRRANATIVAPLLIEGKNVVALDFSPMMRMEAGIATGDKQSMQFFGHQDLAGFFGVVGQALLIDPDFTSALLDLELLGNFSNCVPGLDISRSTFTRGIREREPAEVIRQGESDAGNWYFFTEVRSASRSTAVVHYWFADGRPVGLEELLVEPSARWRTWSAQPAERPDARIWEVVVVERDTGCVLQSRTMQARARAQPVPTPGAYAAYASEFGARLRGFDGLDLQPDPLVVEFSQAMLSGAAGNLLDRAMVDVEIEFMASAQPLSADLMPFRMDDQACSKQGCESTRVCQAAVSRCARRHDGRDCSVCSLRNPLNNRCLSEVNDPVCVAARTGRNDRYEAERERCLVEEERARVDCERLRSQEVRSCEIESQAAEHVCRSHLEALSGISPQQPLAGIEGRVSPSGSAVGRFLDFAMPPDFSFLRMSFELTPGALYTGHWKTIPSEQAAVFNTCLAHWGGDFEGRLLMPSPRLTLIGYPVREDNSWITRWSGFVLPASISPTPLAAVFRERPDLLAACGIALTVESVEEALGGEHAGVLQGRTELDIRPLPSRLVFGPKVLAFGKVNYRAELAMNAERLRVWAGVPVPGS